MRKFILAGRLLLAGVLASCTLAPVYAQTTTPPKLAPCDTSAVLARAQPIFDVGIITLRKACPAFAKRITDWYKATPAAHQWTANQVIAALVAAPFDVPPRDTTPTQPPRDTTPPPVVGSGSCPNEPIGYKRIEDNSWSSLLPSPWFDDFAPEWSQRGAVVQDATAPMSPPNVAAGKFPAGAAGGNGPFSVVRVFKPAEQFKNLYVCMYLKHSANFDNTNGNGGTKFMWPSADEAQGNQFFAEFEGDQMEFGFMQQRNVDRVIRANVSVAAATVGPRKGKWVRYEWLFKANSSNSTGDGGLDVWIDGVLTHHYTNVNYQMNAARTWLGLAWNPTYGWGFNPVPHDQLEYIDHIRLSGFTP